MLLGRILGRLVRAVRASFEKQSVLLTNAGAIVGGNLATAFLGFFYWWFAARHFAPREVGVAAAAVSIMNLLAQIGEFGMGPLLISELPRQARAPGPFVSAALAATLISGFILGVLFLLLVRVLPFDLGHIVQGSPGDVIFLVGVVATGFTLVIDQAFVGVLKSGFPLIRNVCFAVVKLLLLVGLPFFVTGVAKEASIYDTWVAGQLISVIVLFALCAAQRRCVWHAPKLSILRPLVGTVLGHHALNVALQSPTLILPFIVTITLSPQVNAAFYAAWTLVNVVLLAPASLSSVVVTVARREPSLLGGRMKTSLGVSLATTCVASLGFMIFSSFILGLFNPAYPAIAGGSLSILGLGTLGMAIKYHYIAAQRLADRMTSATAWVALGGAVEIAVASLGGWTAGLTGFTRCWLVAVTAEALLMTPTVLAALEPRWGATLGVSRYARRRQVLVEEPGANASM